MGQATIAQEDVHRFVARSNIARFTGLLENETDPKERALLQDMVAEEKARLRQALAATSEARSAYCSCTS